MQIKLFAQIAQLVEQRTENPRVTGSIPVLGTLQVWFNGRTPAFQAGDVGSIPITCFWVNARKQYVCGCFLLSKKLNFFALSQNSTYFFILRYLPLLSLLSSQLLYSIIRIIIGECIWLHGLLLSMMM